CGYSVPRLDFREDRDTLLKWAEKKDADELKRDDESRNGRSIDGLLGLLSLYLESMNIADLRSTSMNALFRFSSAVRRDPAVEEWFRRISPELGQLAEAWFGQMRRCGPDVRELLHDGCPVACVEDVAFGYVNAFTSHVNV